MDQQYAYINADNNPTGFTNNWLEARKPTHYFDQTYADFPLYDEHRQGNAQESGSVSCNETQNAYSNSYNNSYRDIVKTMVERTPLSDMYFSHKNMKHLKNLICRTVYQNSGGKYNVSPDAQSDNELLLVMRSIFLNHAKHLPENIREQVGELNYQVLLYLVPKVISNAQQHLSFIRDHSQQPLPMDRSVNVSSAGTRSNKSITSVFI